LVKKNGARVTAFDLAPEPLQRLRADGAEIAASVAEVVGGKDIVFLCLPSAKQVRAVFEGEGIAKHVRQGQIVIDLGTSSVGQTRDFAGQLQVKGAAWLDAPIARAPVRRRKTARSASWSAERAFSTEYALKDMSYALQLAGDACIRLRGAELIGTILQEAIDAGEADAYFPVIAKLIDRL
jgi:3-hydroxyisobutyrate dehydrogenase-like beta-hydroxyacid dehydrogenase